ncbi:MAG: Ig-like domain-containing protein [Xanthomonadales bacterium]|nr:Ig-like domain-containing protein [Xanthomonadales bacterium]
MRTVLRGALLALCCSSAALAQSVSITGGVPAVESFDSLANTGTANTIVPTGWYFTENGAAGTYAADDGIGVSGSAYSYGTTSTTERAFGSLRSNSTEPMLGARLQNNTGSTLSELLVSYRGEQWRLGVAGRADPLNFQYSLDATSLTSGTWVDFDGLDLPSPNTTSAPGALNGNATGNFVAISATISGGGFTLADGATMWIRWIDPNLSGNDDGLAIDDFSVGLAVDNPPQLTASAPTSGASNVAVASNIALTFSEAVTTTDPWFVLDCGAGAVAGTMSGSGSTRSFDPTLDLPFNASCTVTLTAANIRDTDGTLDPLTGSNAFSFTTVADSAPSVVSTVPADTATGIGVSANLSVTFSEAVTPTLPNWLALSCASSGVHPLTVSGGPTIWTLNPDSDFAFSELCTATIAVANVVDQDGMPNPMAAPKTWTFTTGADLAPMVSSTTPADNAINVTLGSDITVVFSEPVNATTASFTVSCATSGAHTFVLSATPATSFTLNPDADFTAAEVCTVTVTAALVTDTDGAATPMAADYVFDFTIGSGSGDYYAGVDASTCVTLRSTLHDKIDDHTAFPYSHATLPDTWTVLEAADQDPLSSSSVLEVYENASYAKAGGGNSNYNREHTWPNSYGFNNLSGVNGSGVPQSSAYVDTHMLYLSDIEYNSNRGSKPYANCPDTDGCSADATLAYNGFGGGAVTYASGNHNWRKTAGSEAFGSYEVWNHRKGDMARAVLYMDIRYEGGTATGGNTIGQSEPDLIVTDDRNLILSRASTTTGPAYMGLKSTLLAWHAADPPDEHELLRNGVIFSFQGNRNPFIDHPEWAECLFNCNCLPASNPPTATADNANINEDSGANTILVLANDPDPDGGPKLVQSVTQPSGAR